MTFPWLLSSSPDNKLYCSTPALAGLVYAIFRFARPGSGTPALGRLSLSKMTVTGSTAASVSGGTCQFVMVTNKQFDPIDSFLI